MELNYKQRANGVYILSKEDIEKIATDTLKEFSPQNLDYPTALDTDSFLVDHLGLLLKERYLGIPGHESVLGLTVMCESAEILTLDHRCRPTVVEENCGTVVISTSLNSINNKGESVIPRYMKVPIGFCTMTISGSWKNQAVLAAESLRVEMWSAMFQSREMKRTGLNGRQTLWLLRSSCRELYSTSIAENCFAMPVFLADT